MTRRAFPACLLAALTLTLTPALAPSPAVAAEGECRPVGSIVFLPADAVLRVGDAVVDPRRATDLAGSGRDRGGERAYRVEHDNCEWLWLHAEGTGVAGWARANSVVGGEEAVDYYTDLIRSSHRPADYAARGDVWREVGEDDIAIRDYDEAIRRRPGEAADYAGRGRARLAKKDYGRAIADLDEAIRLDPSSPAAYLYRGIAWADRDDRELVATNRSEEIRLLVDRALDRLEKSPLVRNLRDYGRAIADFNEAIRLDPRFAPAYDRRAWLWATCPESGQRDGKRAVASATRACKLTEWKEAGHLSTLAAAYAEDGQFCAAVGRQQAANKLPGGGNEGGTLRLHLYQDGKPYRDR